MSLAFHSLPIAGAGFLVFRFAETTVSNERFQELCSLNPDLRLERTAKGEVIIMAPAGSESGAHGAQITIQVGAWAAKDGRGIVFDASAGFTFPNTSILSPDTSWILSSRWDALSAADRKGFAHICPDFVVELRSPTDGLSLLEAKMQEYIENGAQLGVLVDPLTKTVSIYRLGATPLKLDQPETVDLSPEMPGLVLEMPKIWG